MYCASVLKLNENVSKNEIFYINKRLAGSYEKKIHNIIMLHKTVNYLNTGINITLFCDTNMENIKNINKNK